MGTRSNHVSEEDIQVTNRYMKKCPASLIIRNMQIKTTMRYPLTSVRLVITKRQQMLDRTWRKGNPVHC